MKTHATRDHRFAYISGGDITRWAKGTSRFVYPEPKNKKAIPTLITSLRALKRKETALQAIPETPVMIGPMTKDKSVGQEIESCERSASAIEKAMAFSDYINKTLYGIKSFSMTVNP